MSQVTQILNQIKQGDQQTAEHLLPMVYHELRRLAAWELSGESSDQTLQPTALVHEAEAKMSKTPQEGEETPAKPPNPKPEPAQNTKE